MRSRRRHHSDLATEYKIAYRMPGHSPSWPPKTERGIWSRGALDARIARLTAQGATAIHVETRRISPWRPDRTEVSTAITVGADGDMGR